MVYNVVASIVATFEKIFYKIVWYMLMKKNKKNWESSILILPYCIHRPGCVQSKTFEFHYNFHDQSLSFINKSPLVDFRIMKVRNTFITFNNIFSQLVHIFQLTLVLSNVVFNSFIVISDKISGSLHFFCMRTPLQNFTLGIFQI